MHSKRRTLSFLDSKAVSPVIGSILMVALVVIFTTMISGVILSQYDQPQNPPDSVVKFEQNAHSNVDQTSNLKITLIEEYSSEYVEMVPSNSSIDLYTRGDGTPYLAYETNNSTACANAGKTLNPPEKTNCILNPNDSSYSEFHAQMTTSGDVVYICHVENGETMQVVSKNDREDLVTTEFTARYIQDYSEYEIQPRYDDPCN